MANELLKTLINRLPELEWKLTKPGVSVNKYTIPVGMFNHYYEEPQQYIQEVKDNLLKCQQQETPYSQLYLANKIKSQISVLAYCCNLANKTNSKAPAIRSLQSLESKKTRVVNLEKKIFELKAQREAIKQSLAKMPDQNYDIHLALQKELGELEQQLTTTEEAFLLETGVNAVDME